MKPLLTVYCHSKLWTFLPWGTSSWEKWGSGILMKHTKVPSWKWLSFWDIPETHQKERPGTSHGLSQLWTISLSGWLIPDINFTVRNTKFSSFHVEFYIVTNKSGHWETFYFSGMKNHLSYFFFFFWCGLFLKSLLNLLQNCFSFTFWFLSARYVGSSRTRAWTHVPYIGRQILNHCATREALEFLLLF